MIWETALKEIVKHLTKQMYYGKKVMTIRHNETKGKHSDIWESLKSLTKKGANMSTKPAFQSRRKKGEKWVSYKISGKRKLLITRSCSRIWLAKKRNDPTVLRLSIHEE